jgi:hypothetical protein
MVYHGYSVTVNQVIVASAKRSKSNDFWEPLVLSIATLYQENRDRITISGIRLQDSCFIGNNMVYHAVGSTTYSCLINLLIANSNIRIPIKRDFIPEIVILSRAQQ